MTETTVWICSAGETFDLVALKAYGNERYAAEILAANPDLCRVMIFSGGEQLILPEVETRAAAPIMPVKAPWKEGR